MKTPLGIYRNLPASIYVLFTSQVINSAGMFVYPFLTLYLTQILGYTALKAGMVMTLSSILYIPGSLIGSKLADSIGRKPVMVVFQILMDLSYIACGFFEGTEFLPVMVLVALFFDGAVDPAREALKTDVTDMENRQNSFSLLYLGHNVGSAIGPLVAGYLFLVAPKWLFWGNGIAGMIATTLVIIKIPESKPSKEVLDASKGWKTTEKGEDGGIIKALFTRPQLLLFTLFLSFSWYAYSQMYFALPLITTSLFGPSGSKIYGTLMGFNGLLVVLFNPIFVHRLKRFHPLANCTIANLFMMVSFLLFSFATSVPFFFILAVGYTFGEIIQATNDHYWIANNTPITHRGRFNAILPLIIGSGSAFAPTIGGVIITRFGFTTLWLITATAAFIAAAGMMSLRLQEKKEAV